MPAKVKEDKKKKNLIVEREITSRNKTTGQPILPSRNKENETDISVAKGAINNVNSFTMLTRHLDRFVKDFSSFMCARQ